MLALPFSIKIFLRALPTDMRLGFNGLSALVENEFKEEPTSGHLFVFTNKKRNRMKILMWENGGFWLLCKRLERGTFPINFSSSGQQISRLTLTSMLDGIEIKSSIKKVRFNP